MQGNNEDNNNYYEIKIKELKSQHESLENLNTKLLSELENNTQTNNKYNETLERLKEQIKQYNEKLQLKRQNMKLKEESLNSENNHDSVETEQHKLVPNKRDEEENYLNSLNDVLSKINTKLLNHNAINDNEIYNPDVAGTMCKSIMVIINTKMDLQLNIQFFRIDKDSVFKKIKESAFLLWNVNKEISKDFSFYFIDGDYNINILRKDEEDMSIDNFLKNANNLKKAAFLLLRKEDEYKINPEVLSKLFSSEKKEQKSNKDSEDEISEAVSNFYKSFVGLASYMLYKTKKINIKLQNETSKVQNNTSNNLKYILLVNGITLSLYLIFLILTILSIKNSKNPSVDYLINKSLEKIFSNSSYIVFNNMDSISTDIYYKLRPILISNLTNIECLDGNILVTSIRLSFFRTKNKSCANFYTGPKFCSYDYFNSSTADLDVVFSSSVDIKTDIFIDKEIDNIIIFDKETSLQLTENKTHNQLKDIFDNYQNALFKDMTLTKADDSVKQKSYFNVEGKLGTYSTDGYNLYIESMNDITFKNILYLIQKSNLWNQGLRSVISTFTIYNVKFSKYVYVNILYEICTNGYIVQNTIKITPFQVNVYFGSNGVIMYIFDIIRLISVIFFSLLVFQVILEVRPGIDGKINPMDYIHLLFRPKVLMNITISILFIVSFSMKTINLKYPMQDFKSENKVDFYSAASSFKNVFIIENLLIFALISRILLFLLEIKRIRTFSHLISNTLKRLYFVFLNITFIYLGFVILANNLHGVYYDDYKDIPSSIRIILMISVGFSSNTFQSISPDSNFLFIFIIYMFIVYFLLNTLIGSYLEMSRIVGLMKGHVEDYKETTSILNKQNRKGNKSEQKDFLNKDGISIVS